MKVYIFNHTQEHFSCVLFFFAIYLQTLQAVLRPFLFFFQLHCTLNSKCNCNIFGIQRVVGSILQVCLMF